MTLIIMVIQYHFFFRWLCLWYGLCKTSFIYCINYNFYISDLRGFNLTWGMVGLGGGFVIWTFPDMYTFCFPLRQQLLFLWCQFSLCKIDLKWILSIFFSHSGFHCIQFIKCPLSSFFFSVSLFNFSVVFLPSICSGASCLFLRFIVLKLIPLW